MEKDECPETNNYICRELDAWQPLSDPGVDVLDLEDDFEDKVCEKNKDSDILKAELKAALNEIKDLKEKYSNLTGKLRDKLECPVCYEVPTTTPVPVCPNGHIICNDCKASQCPTCRSRIFNGKSLLAATVIENIEHSCPNKGCQTLSSLNQLETHKTVCPYRLVDCPAPAGKCNKTLMFSDILHHISEDCLGSARKGVGELLGNKRTWSFQSSTGNYATLTMSFTSHDQVFFLTSEKKECGSFAACVQMLGTETECSHFGVDITLHRYDDLNMEGRHLHKFHGDVYSVDMDKKERGKYGLNVGDKAMERIVSEELSKLRYHVTVCLEKYT
eukprot:GFUD01016761.1.p1 GENE.GFUD01016761.1~~GFUD01016761.1.p1  ORF type:complete len:331 (-),score=84.94 GFUD01016761.1:47-1039(-)